MGDTILRFWSRLALASFLRLPIFRIIDGQVAACSHLAGRIGPPRPGNLLRAGYDHRPDFLGLGSTTESLDSAIAPTAFPIGLPAFLV
jgi:hypothetical protein